MRAVGRFLGYFFGSSLFAGRIGLTPDWQVYVRIAIGLARSITASTEPLCFAPYGRHTLIRCAHPSGQPAAVTALRYVSLLAQERCAKEGHPDIRVSLRET
jgi:hypothetical protein